MSAARTILAALLLASAFALAATSAQAATFVVTAQDDTDDGTCEPPSDKPGAKPHCSLREAINAANANPDGDEILFNDSAPITPAAPLPEIVHTTHITSSATGRCRADSAFLRLDGNGADFPGLVYAPGSDNSRLCGVNVRGFTNGIEFRSNGNAIRLSRIGTDPEGLGADPNSDAGIFVNGDNNLIGGKRALDRNQISGNTRDGIFVGEGTGNRIEGNFIGTDATGTDAIPNGFGVDITESATDTKVGGDEADTGNVISGNKVFGVVTSDGLIQRNLIGLDATGTTALPNELAGVEARADAQVGSVDSLNVISGNGFADVQVTDQATVQGNWIGLNGAGEELPRDSTTARSDGVLVLSGTDGAKIGGTEPGALNVIAGHDFEVESVGSGKNFAVEGNLIGLAVDGSTPIPTGVGIALGTDTTSARIGPGNTISTPDVGIKVAGENTRIEGNTVGLNKDGKPNPFRGIGIEVEPTATGTHIGGEGANDGNTLSGGFFGVQLDDNSIGTTIEGNMIGTDAAGETAKPNEAGILIEAQADVTIGGPREAQRNVISGNTVAGIDGIAGSGKAVIAGNFIGVASDGTTALANGDGVLLDGSDSASEGILVGEGNRIAHNAGDGILVKEETRGIRIQANEIFANGDLGIDFANDGVSANGSRSPNLLPPFPVLTDVDNVTAGTLVRGTLDYPAGVELRVDFFASPACDDSGHGQGQTPLGSLLVTGSGGPAAFSARVDAAPAGQEITATVTNLDTRGTSEFSRCLSSTGAPPPPDPPDDPPPGPTTTTPPIATTPAGTLPPPPIGIEVADIPPRIRCKVPKVAGLSLNKAKTRITAAGCGIGKITKPKRPGKNFKLVVKTTHLKNGTTRPEGTAIKITLTWKRVKTSADPGKRGRRDRRG